MNKKGRVFVVGDTHGSLDIGKLIRFNELMKDDLTKKDYIIILGDVAIFFGSNYEEQTRKLIEIYNNFSFTTLFITGNHDDIPRLQSLPDVKMFNSTVGKVSDSIYYLKRTHIYNIYGKTFFTMGGALSIDKFRRTEGVSWWKEEIPSEDEMQTGLNVTYHKHINFILTHTAPKLHIEELVHGVINRKKYEDPMVDYLQKIYDNCTFDDWLVGHMHEDVVIRDVRFVFNYIIELDMQN